MRVISPFVVIISADIEWQFVKDYFSIGLPKKIPIGEFFIHRYKEEPFLNMPIIFLHGGWGKVSAAASTQYAIDRWNPELIINFGTCGGFEGEINRGEILLVEKTIIYDIFEQMGDPDEHRLYYTTNIDLSWLIPSYPLPIKRTLIASGDRDIFSDDIPWLISNYGARAADWESGAIAWVAGKNNKQCLILRGVTDLVGNSGGEAYNGNIKLFYQNTEKIMRVLIDSLPQWLELFIKSNLT